jgi:hypothetical protein
MYSGHLMEELTQMVARAESHAREIKAAAEVQPDPVGFYVPRLVYDGNSQQVLAGVA